MDLADIERLDPVGIAIGRLRLHAPAAETRRCVAALEAADWPHTRAIVFVRQMRVSATPPRLGRAAASAARALVDNAVHGADPRASTAAAVRFRDFEDLIACLAADLAASSARGRWFWQRFRSLLDLHVPEALLRTLAAEPLRLAGITARLADAGRLAPVWSRLPVDTTTDLARRLAHATGQPLPTPVPPTPPAAGSAPPRPAALPGGATAAMRKRWAPALRTLPPTDPRAWLAGCLVLLEWRPQALATGGTEAVIGLLAQLRATPTPTAKTAPSSLPTTHADEAPPIIPTGARAAAQQTADPAQAAAPSFARPAGQGAGAPADATGRSQPLPPPSAPDVGLEPQRTATQAPAAAAAAISRAEPGARDAGAPAPPQRLPKHEQAETQTAPPVPPPADTPPADGPQAAHASTLPAPAPTPARSAAKPRIAAEPDGDCDAAVHTAEGGLFYLVNFLDRPETRALLRRPEACPPEDGWARLWWLGRALELDPDGPLADFLARRLGREDHRGLAALPPWPFATELAAFGAHLYDDAGTPGTPLFAPSLLRLDAMLVHTPTHVDLFCPRTAVRLPVRLAALDTDPGWVPWLGRVLRFHYRDRDEWMPD